MLVLDDMMTQPEFIHYHMESVVTQRRGVPVEVLLGLATHQHILVRKCNSHERIRVVRYGISKILFHTVYLSKFWVFKTSYRYCTKTFVIPKFWYIKYLPILYQNFNIPNYWTISICTVPYQNSCMLTKILYRISVRILKKYTFFNWNTKRFYCT